MWFLNCQAETGIKEAAPIYYLVVQSSFSENSVLDI